VHRHAEVTVSRGCAAVIALCAAVGSIPCSVAEAQVPAPAKPGLATCIKPNEETPEIYGPTDIGATVGNQRLSVAMNAEGTLSVLRWPSPSYYEQLKYVTVDRDLPDLGLDPNEGAFSGLALVLRNGERRTLWLRDLRSRQVYADADSDTVLTRYKSGRYRLGVEVMDVVPQRADVLMRRHVLSRRPRSPVRSARLIAFANLNPTASKRPLLPIEDWCEEEDGQDLARYDQGRDALVWSVEETDQSILQQRSVAVAIGANRGSDGHQVGADHYSQHRSAESGPQSAYDDAADGALAGESEFGPAEADSALTIPIARRPVTVTFAAAASEDDALDLLDRYRGRDAIRERRRKRRSYLRWLERASLPKRAPASVTLLSRRALVSLRQAIDERAGSRGDKVAIVASIATQAPYGQDWIRDGAFFNEALDAIGHHSLVTRHNLFYAEVQKKFEQGAPLGSPLSACQQPTPDGNWFMTNYADGPDAGLFTWEIDETAFGLWTLWRHYQYTRAGDYLERIYPAIRRSAEFLLAFRDPVTGLTPGTACEDDNPPRPGQPTMHASGPVLLAMRSARDAAHVLGRDGDAERYAVRVSELEAAIDQRHMTPTGAWTLDFGDGGWALWPVRVERSYAHERMRAQAEAVWAAVQPSFSAPNGPRMRGQYEAKALHGLAWYHRATDAGGIERVKRGLEWIAGVQARAQRTGILGEAWYVRDGKLLSVVSQPHVWEQVLVYLAALKAYGERDYRPARGLRRARR
jgi:hypothetical protein